MSNRTEYLESFEGRRHQYWSRFKNTIMISYELEKFQTKRSKSVDENLRFQSHLLSKLIENKRRCFQKNVAVEFYFNLNQKNPPAIQSLLKHYIDLIQKPHTNLKTRRKHLILKDDSQIKALCAHYWENNKQEKNSLTIIIKPLRDFIYNLEFARDLQFERFPDKKISSNFDDGKRQESLDKITDLDNSYENTSENFKGYKITIDEKEIDFLEFSKQMYIEDRNQELLKIHSNTDASSVLALITEPESEKKDNSFLNISLNKIGRSTTLNGWYNINLGSVPVSKGESTEFKDRIYKEFKDWKNENGKQLPNNALISLKFFYEKPNQVTHDLDNLLKYVLPHFDYLINSDRYFQKTKSIEIYQIQTVSKNKDSGNLYLRIEDINNNNMFHITDHLLEKYE